MTGLDKRTPTPEDVWDHGYRAGLRDASRGTPGESPNPYRAEKTTDHPCGDYPAPCNCDDPDTHDGATTETTTATTDIAEDALDSLPYFTFEDDDVAPDEEFVRKADVARLLATARTRPTRDDISDAIEHSGIAIGTSDAEQAADAVLALLRGGA